MNYKKEFYKYHNLDECDIILCIICSGVANQLHHIKYKSQGGTNKPGNLAPLCYYCHASHHDTNKPTTEEIKSKALLIYLPF